MANKRRTLYKKRVPVSIKDREASKLYRDTKKIINEVNARLSSLSRKYKTNTWASKKLYNRLSSSNINVISRGRIKLSDNLTNTQLRAIQKASDQFLKSKTSTKSGIKSVKAQTLKSLKSTMNDIDEDEFTDDEIEVMYDMLGDSDFNTFNEKIGASGMWAIIDDAIDAGDSEEMFIKRINDGLMTISNDLDLVKKARRLYEKYVI